MSVETGDQAEIVDDSFIAFRARFELAQQKRSQASVARDLGVSEMSLSRRLRGEVPFTVVELAEFAQVLGVELAVFFPPNRWAS